MSKNLELKQQAVAEIKERFEKAKSVVIVDYRGINVEQVTELRKQFRAAGVEYVVLKNTLVRRVVDEMGLSALDGANVSLTRCASVSFCSTVCVTPNFIDL